jgi:hypothetical protein
MIFALTVVAVYGWLYALYLHRLLAIERKESASYKDAYRQAMDHWRQCNNDWATLASGAVKDVAAKYHAWAALAEVALKALQAEKPPKDPTVH